MVSKVIIRRGGRADDAQSLAAEFACNTSSSFGQPPLDNTQGIQELNGILLEVDGGSGYCAQVLNGGSRVPTDSHITGGATQHTSNVALNSEGGSCETTLNAYVPGAETPPALDVGKVILDRDAVEAGAEILVEAGHSQLRGDQFLRGNAPAARKPVQY